MPLSIGSFAAALRRGVALREEPYGRLHELDAAMRERLRAFRPVVALHRAGNAVERIAPAAATGALVEADVQGHNGALVVSHEHRAGPLSYDWQRRLLRLGDPPPALDAMLTEAHRVEARLLLDLKLDASWAPALIGALKRHDMLDASAFTGAWDVLDQLADSGDVKGALNYGGINRAEKLERFVAQQAARRRPGVSLHGKLASRHNLERLHATGASVYVYVISEPEEALALLELGADGLVTNNLVLAEVWS